MRGDDRKLHPHYPGAEEVDAWVESIFRLNDETPCKAEVVQATGFRETFGTPQFGKHFRYVRFEPQGMEPFYAYWQPAHAGPAPLLVHVPGYGAEMSAHPELVAAGYNVLHINPLGYVTPDGPQSRLRTENDWPVLPDTIASAGQAGYRIWLANCVAAIEWAMKQPSVQPNRVSFFGTSQGGGGALLLGSMYRDRGARAVAADEPFLTHFPLADARGAYRRAPIGLERTSPEAGWRGLGFVDTMNHARRLTLPVLLTAGEADDICPPETIQALFERLPGTRSLTMLSGEGHGYTSVFVPLASAWFRLYA
ncbi:acetylxylan esterase [Paenibacillus sp.]|uniref:acetylxylan esterase n=1 Tax=Paenibacillus sp. TaxID=58172 RepID=UPI002D30A9E6|nr:acetylxylan esterase [Paenibacillus sp.]HZG56267.1 acetylxylan esterase [Paenibacillus sp.]